MTSPEPRPATLDQTPTPARVWGDQWLRVSEMVLRGLNHQLSNRVASIEAVVSLLDPALPDPALVESLGVDVTRLVALMRLYRLLPAEQQPRVEPLRLQELAPVVAELHGYHADLRSVGCEVDHDQDALPVCARPSALLRVLLVLLESVAGEARRSGGTSPVRLSYRGTDREVRIALETRVPPRAGGRTVDGILAAARTTLAHGRASVATADELEADGAVLCYEIRLPTLPEVRRLEREEA